MAKFYAVRVGKKPGIYMTWPECEAQVKGFPGAKYKSFPTKAEAEAFVNDGAAVAAAKPEVKNDIVDPKTALSNLRNVVVGDKNSVSVTAPAITAGLGDKLALMEKAFEEAVASPIAIADLESQEDVQPLIRKYDIALGDLSFDENISFVDGGGDKEAANDYESTRILFGVVLFDADKKEFSLYRYAMEKNSGFDWLFRASNVAGEEMAALLAMYLAKKRGLKQLKIYQDNNLPAKYYSGAFKKIHNEDDYALEIFINESIKYLEEGMEIYFLYVPSEHAVSKSSEKKRKGTAMYESQTQITKLPFETAEFLNAISDRLADYRQ